MQPKITFMHICEHAFLDDRRRVCLIGIFDVIEAATLPATPTRLCIAGTIIGRPNDLVPVTLAIVREDTSVAISESHTEFNCGPTGSHGFILELSGLQFPDHGRYAIGIFLTADTPLALSFVTVRPQQASPPPGEVLH